jgi:hypothetical protein
MPQVADVVRRSGGESLERCGPDLRPSHRRALDALLRGRTEALGGQLWPCAPCGQEPSVYHACRHRRCPPCPRLDTEAWLAERRQELLPLPSCHVVCTLPQARRVLVRRHQPDLSDILRRAAAPALLPLAADPHDVGGLIGVLCVLHPWPRTLPYHPQVHWLVPAGGGSADRTEGRPARTASLVPVHALAQLLRGLLQALVQQERPDLTLPEAVWPTGWGVSGKPAMPGTELVLNDLGRYVHRLALTNSRLLSPADGQGSFRYPDAQDQRWKLMT